MSKWLAIACALGLALSVTACDNKNGTAPAEEKPSAGAAVSAHKAEALADLLSGRLDDLLRQHEPAGMADPGAETSPGMGAVSDEGSKGDG